MLSIGKQLTAEQRLNKATVDIMANPKYVALAGILMIGDRGVKDDIPTACTNGRDEWYGREFVEKLNDAELRFLVLHESYHKLYRHLMTTMQNSQTYRVTMLSTSNLWTITRMVLLP